MTQKGAEVNSSSKPLRRRYKAAVNPIDMEALAIMVDVYGAQGLEMLHKRDGVLAYLNYLNPQNPVHLYRGRDVEYTAIRFHKTLTAIGAVLSETDKHPALKQWVFGAQMPVISAGVDFMQSHQKKVIADIGAQTQWGVKLTQRVAELNKRLDALLPAPKAAPTLAVPARALRNNA